MATELRYSPKARIEAVNTDENYDTYSISELHKIGEKASQYAYLRVYIDHEKLRSIEPLVLVDMPGFDSPLDSHQQAIMVFINRGAHYIVLTSVEDGNITHSMQRHLSDIKEFNRGFSCFVSKCNLRAKSETQEVVALVEEQLFDIFGKKKKAMPIGSDGGESLEVIINHIKPDDLIEKIFKEKLKKNHYKITETFNTTLSAYKNDQRQNEQAIIALNNGLTNLENDKQNMLDEARERYSNTRVNRIIDTVGKELSESVDELISSYLSGGGEAFSSSLAEIVRHSLIRQIKETMNEISENIVDDLTNGLKRTNGGISNITIDDTAIMKIGGEIKSNFQQTNNILASMHQRQKDKDDTSGSYRVITTILGITTNIITPALELLIIFLPSIMSLFGASESRKKEKIHHSIIGEAIPKVKRELGEKLPAIFKEQVDQIIEGVSLEIEQSLSEKREEIKKAEKVRSLNQNAIQKKIDLLNSSLDKITEISNNTLYT